MIPNQHVHEYSSKRLNVVRHCLKIKTKKDLKLSKHRSSDAQLLDIANAEITLKKEAYESIERRREICMKTL